MGQDENYFPKRGLMILLPHFGVGVDAIPLLVAATINESVSPVIVHYRHSDVLGIFPSQSELISENLIKKFYDLPPLLNSSGSTAHLKKENINRAAQFIEINKRKGGKIKGKHRRMKK